MCIVHLSHHAASIITSCKAKAILHVPRQQSRCNRSRALLCDLEVTVLLSVPLIPSKTSLQDAAAFAFQVAGFSAAQQMHHLLWACTLHETTVLPACKQYCKTPAAGDSQILKSPAHPHHPPTARPTFGLVAAGDKMSRISPDRGRIITNMISVALGLPTSWLVLKGLPTANIGQHTLLYAVVLGTFGSLISW